jgi:histidinol-phosphate aminotransferase
MQRRAFLKTGLALGAVGAASVVTGCGHQGAPGRAPAPHPAAPKVHRPIRLSWNENPLGLGPAAQHAVQEGVAQANRYARDSRRELAEAIGAANGVGRESVVTGAGSTEVIWMALMSAPPAATVVVADPTFEDVAEYSARLGRKVVKVPLRADWAHDLERMREETRRADKAVAFICNPNNPTGTITPSAELDAWIRESDERVTFLIDEAYFDYVQPDSGETSARKWVKEKPNVIVTRTFSKMHAMAGLRLGYGLAHTELRKRMWACSLKNNVNVLAIAAGRASLADSEFQRKSIEMNRLSRDHLTRKLDELGLAHLPSHSNFLMHKITGNLQTYIDRMMERGIMVGRPFPPLVEYSRVSIGLPEEMEAFTEELHEFRSRGWI